jgi:hypothetical protein
MVQPPAGTDAMVCGYDQYTGSGCSGQLLGRSLVALGVCVRVGSASVKYTDCSLNGRPSTFQQYSDQNCLSPSVNPTIVPEEGRTCLGGACAAGGLKYFCNGVITAPNPDDCITSPDLTGDGKVDIMDVFVVLDNWGICGTDVNCLAADLNCDLQVNIEEIFIIVGAWSET